MTKRFKTTDPSSTSRYEERGEIAKGGCGIVFKVFDHDVERYVAAKVLKPRSKRFVVEQFFKEARITALLDHPNIVPIYGIERDINGIPDRFIMKLVHGKTLKTILDEQNGKPFQSYELERILRVFITVCDAISFAHSKRVIHRDLKPHNIMIERYGQVYIMDWGIAMVMNEASSMYKIPNGVFGSDSENERTNKRRVAGTPAYMAPEQANGDEALQDERTDVFGLGSMLYHILTLRPPYRSSNRMLTLEQARSCNIVRPESIAPQLNPPLSLCDIAMKALMPDPFDRYQSVDDLKNDINVFLRKGGWFALRSFDRGTIIVREGDLGDTAYIIQKGNCRVYHEVAGDKHMLRTLGPGEVFGELAIFASQRRTATVEAESDVTAIVITKDAFEQELPQGSWIRAFVNTIAKRFIELDLKQNK